MFSTEEYTELRTTVADATGSSQTETSASPTETTASPEAITPEEKSSSSSALEPRSDLNGGQPSCGRIAVSELLNSTTESVEVSHTPESRPLSAGDVDVANVLVSMSARQPGVAATATEEQAASPVGEVEQAGDQDEIEWAIPSSKYFSTIPRDLVPERSRGAPFALENDPRYLELTEAERHLCCVLRIPAEKYLDVRGRMFKQYHKVCSFDPETGRNMRKIEWSKSKAQRVKGMDANKISKLFAWYDELGLWDHTWVGHE